MEQGKEKLYVKMFGFFDVTYKGKSIFPDSTSSIKSIAILRFMLSQKNKLFLAETIAENVWPENEYLDEKKVIRTYIHRLRRILVAENSFRKDFSSLIRILNVKGSYILETSDEVEMDTELFETLKTKVAETELTENLMNIFEELLELYTGEFLEECRFDHWVLMLRNYYLRLFCSTVNAILAKLETNSAFAEILDICERSFKVYELDEGISIAFIKALIDFDRITDALQHYNYITTKMYNELSVTPSEKMRLVYAGIKAKKKDDGHEETNVLEAIDTNTLMIMIDEAVRHQLAPEKNKYSLGYVKILPNELQNIPEFFTDNSAEEQPKEEQNENISEVKKSPVLESLKQAIEFALRKNDMYVITDDLSALILLYEAAESSYPIIANRIKQSFYSRHDGFDSKLHIRIYPSLKIM